MAMANPVPDPGRGTGTGNMDMDTTIGVNLRVTAHSSQGGRKYMEDMLCVAYQPTSDDKDLLYAYFGIFDGHGGREAAAYTKQHLMDNIVSQKNFWDDDDTAVLKAIHDGFLATHHSMLKELNRWPKTGSGLPSTSGTTATMAFVRRSKLYIGHVGDSGLILGFQDPESGYWRAKSLTKEHKPENADEIARITQCGGKVVRKSGVPRVVWNRPRIGHQGPVRRSTPIEEIPFLAVARSLGDFWSYNSDHNEFVVSPEPDVCVVDIDVRTFRCLIFGSDGLWNMLNAQEAVNSVYFAEKNNERQLLASPPETASTQVKNWINPSKRLVDRALDRWYHHNLRADNTSVVTVVIDPPGPPKSQVFRATYKDVASWRAGSAHYNIPRSPSSASEADENAVDDELCNEPGPSRSQSLVAPPTGSDPVPTRIGFPMVRSLSDAATLSMPKSDSISEVMPLPGITGKTHRQVLRTRRATTSSLPFPLRPPIIATSVRAVYPRRPVWTQRRKVRDEIGSSSGSDVVPASSASAASGAADTTAASAEASSSQPVPVPGCTTETPATAAETGSKRHQSLISDPSSSLDDTSKRFKRSDDKESQNVSCAGSNSKLKEQLSRVDQMPIAETALQINEVTSSSEVKSSDEGQGSREVEPEVKGQRVTRQSLSTCTPRPLTKDTNDRVTDGPPGVKCHRVTKAKTHSKSRKVEPEVKGQRVTRQSALDSPLSCQISAMKARLMKGKKKSATPNAIRGEKGQRVTRQSVPKGSEGLTPKGVTEEGQKVKRLSILTPPPPTKEAQSGKERAELQGSIEEQDAAEKLLKTLEQTIRKTRSLKRLKRSISRKGTGREDKRNFCLERSLRSQSKSAIRVTRSMDKSKRVK